MWQDYKILFRGAQQCFANSISCQLRCHLSDTISVRPSWPCTCIGLCDTVRPIVSWLEPDGKCAVVDPSRKAIPLPTIVASVHSQPGYMVIVVGDGYEIWNTECRGVICELFVVNCYGWKCESPLFAVYCRVKYELDQSNCHLIVLQTWLILSSALENCWQK